jgi:hypothetical protein
MNSKRKWLKKFNVLFAVNSHTNLWNVEHATNCFVNIVNCNFNRMEINRMNMLITILMTDLKDGEVLVEPLTTNLHLLEEAEEINNQSLH